MSVEPLVIAAIVEEGNLRKVYQEGISPEDFQVFGEEFEWIEKRAERKRTINARTFRERFPDFEWVVSNEPLKDLIEELKQERAYVDIRALIDSVDETLEPENAIETAENILEIVNQIRRQHSPQADVALIGGYQEHLERMRQLRLLREQGVTPGLPTGISHLDHHWDGLVPGRLITVLGRPGESKSYFQSYLACAAMLGKFKIGMFSPEMNEHEHICRVHTILSANKKVQAEVGLTESFRNRSLMRGEGFNIKRYKRFCEYLDSIGGEIILFTQKYRRAKMSPSFIEAKIQDLGLDLVIIDPIYKLRSPRKRENKVWELSDIVDAVQGLAESYDIPIIISNQANRQGPKDDAPHKDTSFGSDSPAQESDHVIGVKHEVAEKLLVLRCTKSRFGENFRVTMRFLPNTGLMKEIDSVTREDDEDGTDFSENGHSVDVSELLKPN